MAEINNYEYELTKQRELDYNYMMAKKKCLQIKENICDFQDLHDLQMAISAKVYAKQAYELQEKLVTFILNEQPGFTEVQNAFKYQIEAKISAQPFRKTTF